MSAHQPSALNICLMNVIERQSKDRVVQCVKGRVLRLMPCSNCPFKVPLNHTFFTQTDSVRAVALSQTLTSHILVRRLVCSRDQWAIMSLSICFYYQNVLNIHLNILMPEYWSKQYDAIFQDTCRLGDKVMVAFSTQRWMLPGRL